jgi:hypothetical protein
VRNGDLRRLTPASAPAESAAPRRKRPCVHTWHHAGHFFFATIDCAAPLPVVKGCLIDKYAFQKKSAERANFKPVVVNENENSDSALALARSTWQEPQASFNTPSDSVSDFTEAQAET